MNQPVTADYFLQKEIFRLSGFEKQKGLTIVPISVYNKGSKIKIEIGIAKGKRNTTKERQ